MMCVHKVSDNTQLMDVTIFRGTNSIKDSKLNKQRLLPI